MLFLHTSLKPLGHNKLLLAQKTQIKLQENTKRDPETSRKMTCMKLYVKLIKPQYALQIYL